MKRFLLFLLLSPFLLLSCEKETVLTLDQSSISFTDAGGSQTVSLTANKPWTVSTNQSWCKVSPSGGEEAASSRVTITCDANTSYDERSCTVTFTCAELTKTVSVTQATNNGLLVSQTSYELTKAAQQLNIEVRANVKFSVDVDASCKDWITYNTTKGLTANTVVLDIAENKSYDSREGKVTIKQNGGNLSSTITIKQSQLDGLFISTPEYNLSNEKHTLTVEVSTNVEFDVTSEADWVKYVQTKGLNSKQIILEVAENDTYDQRETRVNVKQKNGDIRGTIIIKQDEKYGILVTQSEYNLSNEAQTIEVEVKYNVDFDVIMPSECKTWIKQVSTKSLDSKTYSLSISQNKTYDNREGSITFKQKNGDISTTVAVKQAQTDYLEVVKNEYIVDIEGETISIDIQSNVDYSVSLNEGAQSWLSIVETKGISKNQVLIAVASGDDNTDRKGMVIISYGNLKRTVMIHQYSYAANTIIQFADEKIKAKLVEAFDTNKDGEISIKEARAVKSIEGVFGSIKTYKSFDEFQYFTGISAIPSNMFEGWRLSSIIIPASVNKISSAAFRNCKSLQTIIIPNSVTTMNSNCFEGCDNLNSVTLSSSLTEIGSNAFKGCINLESIVIPESVSYIGDSAFRGCAGLTSATIQGAVAELNGTFLECGNLSTVELNEGLQILRGAFYGCKSLQSIVLPEGVSIISISNYEVGYYPSGRKKYGGCFEGCTKLSEIYLPQSLGLIKKQSFKDCSSLRAISIPDHTFIEGAADGYSSQGAFYNCVNLQSVILPTNITKIGIGTFMGCSSLKTIKIPESVTSIEGSAFSGCSGLTSITIPESLTSIGDNAFSGCSGLTSITIPESVTSIGFAAFYDCRSLTSIVIPESLTSIEVSTFSNCSSLTSITIPESVTSIGAGAFSRCSSLRTVVLPENITSIENHTFLNCSSLTSVVIPESVIAIKDEVFSGCGSLYSIEIPESVTSIGDDVFRGCSSIESIVIPKSVVKMGFGVFSGCLGLVSVFLPQGLTELKSRTDHTGFFDGCSSLQSIQLPECLTSIDEFCFQGCGSLTSITIPESVTSVGRSAFANCSSLRTIVLPEGITAIEESTFKNCSSLTAVVIPKNVTLIGDSAFSHCSSVSSIDIPHNVSSIGADAFRDCSHLEQIIVRPINPPSLRITYNIYGNFNGTNDCPICVPAGSVSNYKAAYGWNYYAHRIQAIPE